MKRAFKLFIIFILLLSTTNVYSEEEEKIVYGGKKLIKMATDDDRLERDRAFTYVKLNLPPELKELIKESILDNQQDEVYIHQLLSLLKLYPEDESIDTWIDIMSEIKNNNIKIYIIKFFGTTYNKKTVMSLTKELKNPYLEIRRAAIKSLNKIGDDRMYPVIFAMARNENPIYRIYALESLYYTYDMRLLPIIHKMIYDKNKSVRIFVLRCVIENRIDSVLPQVRRLVRRDANYEVRVKAIETVVKLGDRKSKSVLVYSLRHEKYQVRQAAVQALSRLNFNSVGVVASRLASEDNHKVKDLMLDYLIKYRSNGGIYTGLKNILVYEKSASLRIKAAYMLGLMKSRKAENLLFKGVKDSDQRVRAESANSLKVYKDKKSATVLLGLIRNEKSRYTRSAALYSLSRNKSSYIREEMKRIKELEKDPVFKYQISKIYR